MEPPTFVKVMLLSCGLEGAGYCALLFNLPPILHSSRPPGPRGTRHSRSALESTWVSSSGDAGKAGLAQLLSS
ncbi:hypothetical protein DNTS_016624 [Danionella cerebrum]|uniref:Uncharacterized protein n=1 Tax=Danionella cerebrum TaxID=2873325 RepID=A0A553N1Q2_9TELE|nr:hypothetical protein DNTS_016624 [Danionella translucida]